MITPLNERNPAGGPGFEMVQVKQRADDTAHQHKVDKPRLRLMSFSTPTANNASSPLFAHEVIALADAGHNSTYDIFLGPNAVDAAVAHRVSNGTGTAVAVLDTSALEGYSWPAAAYVRVQWADSSESALAAKRGLARALVRDGVGYAAIPHSPAWLNIWLEVARRPSVQSGPSRHLQVVP